ncbi:aspartic proteinase CDR1-like [Impatiens glandulifera]|uniref:aspartic proteinase CDR1-like n=1 Tax=Impatiens glandulifera TaxID=253017 RepID=UPI001FB066D0|nr:aspartic proteinase CDR1-like [Impatiens glandulifera]
MGNTSIRNMIHGCGHRNFGYFNEDSSGMIGLGDGPLSFFGQTQHLIDGMFSYCLVSQVGPNPHARSRINFGINAEVSGPTVIHTELIKKKGMPFYFLSLKSISVRNRIIQFTRKYGEILIDSGTTLNYFPRDVMQNLKKALILEIGKNPLMINNEFCYKMNTDIPDITFHFAMEANITLSKRNTFSAYGNALCLNMKAEDHISIFGNKSQMDFLVGYDIPSRIISFKPTDCSKHVISK